jgi:hypothetical protein
VHVMLMGADLGSWTTQLISGGLLNSSGSSLLVMRTLLVNSFHISPGPGLLVLTTCPGAVSEARFDRRMKYEQAAPARFRYSDLKEAGRGCGGRGPYGD